MYYRRIKRKCNVRGCKNTDSYAISLTSEVGNTIAICKRCLENALKSIEEGKPVPEKQKSSGIPSLFFSNILKEDAPAEPAETPAEATIVTDDHDVSGLLEDDGVYEPASAEEPSDAEPTEEPETAQGPFTCPHCGQVCKTALGLQKHIDAKHKDVK